MNRFNKSRSELDFWIQSIGSPLLVVEKHSLTVICGNRGAERFFAIGQDKFPGLQIAQLVGAEANQMLGQIWSNAPVGVPGEPFMLRSVVQQQQRLLMVQVSKLIVEQQDVRLFTFMDAPPDGSVALVSWQEKIIDMLNWLPFGFEIATTDDQIQFANSQFTELFGYSPHEIENIEDWWCLAYPDPDYRAFAKQKWATEIAQARAENREMTPFDLDVVTRSGMVRTIQFRHRTIGEFNTNLYLDVTFERSVARRLKTLSETDPLTGAMNRRQFFEEAHQYFGAGNAHRTAVLALDIDHFKSINDTHGHAVGDLVLQEFTARCRSLVAETDIFARFGGEEFIVLLRNHSQHASHIAERIRLAVAESKFLQPHFDLAVTVSIGLAYHEPQEDVEQLLSRADKALYNAKATGRNKVIDG